MALIAAPISTGKPQLAPANLRLRGSYDRELRYNQAPVDWRAYGWRVPCPRRTGTLSGILDWLTGSSDPQAAAYEKQLAEDRSRYRWRGPRHDRADEFANVLLTAVRHTRFGNVAAAEKAFARARGLLPSFAKTGAASEASRLLSQAESEAPALALQVSQARAELEAATRALQAEAAVGSTPEALAAEAADQRDSERARLYGPWAYGLSALPGGGRLVDAYGAAEAWASGPGRKLLWGAAALGAIYVGIKATRR